MGLSQPGYIPLRSGVIKVVGSCMISMGGATLSLLRPEPHQIFKKFQMTSFTSLIPRLVINFCVMVYYTTDYWLPLIGIVERLQNYMSYMCID